MEAIYTHGIWMAESLQQRMISHEKQWQVVTHMGDPKAAFLLVFPFTYFINKRAGVAVLWVAAISEWLNLVFKWMLFGERPFWWIGSPSGHAMVTAAVWWVVVSSLGSYLHSRTHRGLKYVLLLTLSTAVRCSAPYTCIPAAYSTSIYWSKVLSAVPYLLYVVMLVAVGLSRIFILAHFPHQVVTGCITGVILGIVLGHRVPEGRPLLFFFSLSIGLLFGTVMFHAGLRRVGINLSWSIALAKKWCSRPEWIRLDTVPFSSLTRDCGALLGLGLAQYWKPGGWSLPWAPRALSLAFSSMGLYHVNRLPLPVQPQGLFYGLFFVKFVLVPQIVMVLVPGLVHLFTHKKKKD